MKQINLKPKIKNKLFVFIIQDEEGRNVRVLYDSSYDLLWLKGTAEAKAMRGWWSIFDLEGKFVDGNYKQVVIK